MCKRYFYFYYYYYLFLLLNYVTTNLRINRIFNNISSGNQSDGKDFYLRRSRRRLYCLGSAPCITLFPFTFLIANQSVPAEIPIWYCILPFYFFIRFYCIHFYRADCPCFIIIRTFIVHFVHCIYICIMRGLTVNVEVKRFSFAQFYNE